MTGRYSRQVRFEPFGAEGQRRVESAHVWIVGIGALGTHVADQLVRAGVGRTILIDRDVVEWSNLQRQSLFREADATQGLAKADAAAAHLRSVRADAEIHAFAADYHEELHDRILARHGTPDLVVDGTDNFPTRFAINDLCVRSGIPWIYGGAVGGSGSAATIIPGRTPCLRCLVPEAPSGVASCETDGVLAPAVASVAAFQSMEALKILGGRSDAVTRGVYRHDLWRGSVRIHGTASPPDPECRTCGTREFPALAEGPLRGSILCGRNAVQVHPRDGGALDLDALAASLSAALPDIRATAAMLRFEADGVRFSVFPDGRALLFGLDNLGRAQALYDRWLGQAPRLAP